MVTSVSRNRRRQRSGKAVFLLLIVFACCHFSNLRCLADEDEDFLAEILAEEAKQEEEHARMEAELREMEAMRAQQQNAYTQNPKGGGKPKMGRANTNMPKSTFSKLEDELKKKETQQSAAQKAQQASAEEEAAARKAEQIRLKREAAYEASLKKMNEEERKKAQQQKAADAKVVSRILKHSARGNHYAVLGIHNLEFQLGPYYIFNWSLGPLVLFHTTTKKIKSVYRNLARTVHPDKNKDGRAEEAFHAIETSAAILTDEKKRKEYDKRIISARRRRNKETVERVMEVSGRVWNSSTGAISTVKKVLGPFSTPIIVIGALIV
jgi:chemotaxis protein histidine kinase CheA